MFIAASHLSILNRIFLVASVQVSGFKGASNGVQLSFSKAGLVVHKLKFADIKTHTNTERMP
jgi:hypothetical protein